MVVWAKAILPPHSGYDVFYEVQITLRIVKAFHCFKHMTTMRINTLKDPFQLRWIKSALGYGSASLKNAAFRNTGSVNYYLW